MEEEITLHKEDKVNFMTDQKKTSEARKLAKEREEIMKKK